MNTISDQSTFSLERYMALGLIVSLLVHIVMLLALSRTTPTPAPVPMIVDIIMEPSQVPAKPQIVTEPSNSKAKLPFNKNARLTAEHNAYTEKEQIKRGDGLNAGAVGMKVQTQTSKPSVKVSKPQKQTQAKPKTAITHKKITSFTLDQSTAMEKFGVNTAPSAKLPNKNITTAPSQPRPFSRPAGSGAVFLGAAGSADYLPHLPDGDITLLNAKAGRFAVFVRRVASRVFGNLRQSGWEFLRINDIRNIGAFTTVRARLSLEGKLLDVTLTDGSGSSRFDQVVFEAAKKGALDPHPPPEAAASDGTIRLIFQAKSWSKAYVSRSGAPSERRWLLLGTGLE